MTSLQDAMKIIKPLQNRFKKSHKSRRKTKIADDLLGAFKGATEGKSSSQCVRELRNSSYGKFK